MNKKFQVTAIVPAYNEEKKVYNVLHALVKTKGLDEIICVNDGSTDRTLYIIKKAKAPNLKIINLKKNHGKSYAIAHGIRKAKGQIIIFVDADLKGLKENHINQIIAPLMDEKFDAVIGYPYWNNLDKLFLPLSGERAYFKKDLVPHLLEIEKKGYGMELFLNYLFKDKKIKLFPLKGVRHILKHEKQSIDVAAKMTLIEGIDILSEIIKQNNPVSYMIKTYLYRFYFGKPKTIDQRVNRLIKYIKKQLKANF